MPISFLELVPKRPSATITIEAADGAMAAFEISGVPLVQLAELGRRYPSLTRVLEGNASIISASDAMPALVQATDDGFTLRLEQTAFAVAPGQVAVLYDDDAIVGAGVIVAATG